ncbi:hypothetical protein KKG61_04275 [bacterium]|nr:hypothetical protein [bacterium]MBU1599305.1 hypothetical protein [bacterium]MBU2462368.1 hypothetical protein [bacterium]
MAISILGVCLTVLGLIFAYVWKGNHKMETAILEGQRVLSEGQKIMMQGLERIEEGQKEGFRTLSEMLLTQTKILERIEAKIP